MCLVKKEKAFERTTTLKRFGLLLGIIVMISFVLLACSNDSNDTLLHEPQKIGTDSNGYPEFLLHWEPVRNAIGYEIAIHAELTGYSGWSTSKVEGKKNTERAITLLQGIYTDSAKYQIKIRPEFQNNRFGEWSNEWIVNFDKGEFELEECVKSIGKPAASPVMTDMAEEERYAEEGTVQHILPESLTEWLHEETERDTINLSDTKYVTVEVRRAYYSEPLQTVKEPKVVQKIVKALSEICVNEEAALQENASTVYIYSLFDSKEQKIANIMLRDGNLIGSKGTYSVEGIENLQEIEGIFLELEWDEYWREQKQLDEKFDSVFRPAFPENVFRMSGRNASELFRHASKVTVERATLYMPYNYSLSYDVESERETTDRILESLLKIQIPGTVSITEEGQEWRIILDYKLGNATFPSSIEIVFFGNCFVSDAIHYEIEGAENLLKLFHGETSKYLREHRMQLPAIPVY